MARTTRPSSRTLALVQQASISQQGRDSPALSRLLQNHERRITVREEKLVDEVYTRIGAANGALIIHEFTTRALGQAHVQAQRGFIQTAQQLNAAKNWAFLDPETRQDAIDFTTAQKEMARRHFAANLEGVAQQLIRLTSDDLYEKDEEEPHGFLAMLFRGRR